MDRFVCGGFCLFDLVVDPCETRDVAGTYPEVVEELKAAMEVYWKTLVPRPEYQWDPIADPKHFNSTWCTWLDTENPFCHYND